MLIPRRGRALHAEGGLPAPFCDRWRTRACAVLGGPCKKSGMIALAAREAAEVPFVFALEPT